MYKLITLLCSPALFLLLFSTSVNALPPNAHAVGNGWECNTGFKRQGQQCNKIFMPPNANPERSMKTKTSGGDVDLGVVLYRKGDYAEALKVFRPLATKGNADAQFYLGVMYDSGYGVLTDKKLAFAWYKKAALQGDITAQANLGIQYSLGRGVLKDHKKSVYWFQKAALEGHAEAQTMLGIAYAKGEGILQDNKQAMYWHRKAASQGSPLSLSLLTLLYCASTGPNKDLKECAVWVKIAYENGDPTASGTWNTYELWKYQ